MLSLPVFFCHDWNAKSKSIIMFRHYMGYAYHLKSYASFQTTVVAKLTNILLETYLVFSPFTLLFFL